MQVISTSVWWVLSRRPCMLWSGNATFIIFTVSWIYRSFHPATKCIKWHCCTERKVDHNPTHNNVSNLCLWLRDTNVTKTVKWWTMCGEASQNKVKLWFIIVASPLVWMVLIIFTSFIVTSLVCKRPLYVKFCIFSSGSLWAPLYTLIRKSTMQVEKAGPVIGRRLISSLQDQEMLYRSFF